MNTTPEKTKKPGFPGKAGLLRTKRIPASACRLRSGPFELAAAGDGEGKSPPQARILARSGEGIPHWYWGKLVQDLAGMQQLKDRLPLDYCHDPGEVLGYAEDWTRDSGDLRCIGTLLVEQSERAAEVVSLARSGVPYEASITFTPITVEYLDPGQVATANGRQVDGPAAIVRTWLLTGLAVCPRGADPNTRTELSATAGEIEVTIKEAESMAEINNETPEQIAARVQTELTARIEDYLNRFGSQGQGWALSSRPLVECYQDLVTQLREQHATDLAAVKDQHATELAAVKAERDAASKKAGDAETRLSQIGLGEAKPASSVPAEGGSKPAAGKYETVLSGNLARVAAGIKMPE